MRFPAAGQMQNVRALIESRPRVEPADDVVRDAGSGAERVQAAAAADGSTLMAYTAGGRDVTVDLGAFAGGSAQPWWFDPRTGEATRLDAVEGGGTATFRPPATEGDEADWVLVVDDAGAGLVAPGTGRSTGHGSGGGPETGASGQDLDDPDAEIARGSAGRPEPAYPQPADLQPADPQPADPEPEPAQATPRASAEPVWDQLAECESSGEWGVDTGNGYHGGLQFDTPTWSDYGGAEFAPDAHLATREEQIAVAARVRDDRGGYGSWPACASRLGLPRWSRWSR
jgi:hypothetical protein